MRLRPALALAAVAVAATTGFASANDAIHIRLLDNTPGQQDPCDAFIDFGCVVHDPNGAYTCTFVRVAGICIFEWAP